MKRCFRVILGLIVCCYVVACQFNGATQQPIYEYLPKDADLIFEVSDFELFKSDWQQNSLLSNFSTYPLNQFLTTQGSLLEQLNPDSKSYLALKEQDSVAQFFFVTRNDSTLVVLDSVPNRMVEQRTQASHTFQKITIEDQITYIAVIDSVFLATSSSEWLLQQLSSETRWESSIEKLFRLKEASEVAIIYNKPLQRISDSTQKRLGGPGVWDVNVLSGGLETSGVIAVTDSLRPLLKIFDQQQPQTNLLPEILPNTALKAISATYTDGNLLLEQLSKQTSDSIALQDPEGTLGATNEIGSMTLPSGNAWAFRGIDAARMMEVWIPFLNEADTFRDLQLYSVVRTPEVFQPLQEIMGSLTPTVAFEQEGFIVFAENEQVAEAIIIAAQTNNILNKTSYYKTHMEVMAGNASLVYYHWEEHVSNSVSHFFFRSKANNTTPLSSYPFSMLQFIHEGSFAHANFACLPTGTSQQPPGQVSQRFSKTLDRELLTPPQFFTNHRTKGKDVIVQDVQNNIHLLNATGKVLWSKSLKEPLVGTFHEIDLLRNGKKQLAFTTKNALHVWDRNGNPVAPFPVQFNDDITQPLAVFDYDNNRKYRFAIVQGEEILLYDSNAKVVSGFTFRKAKSTIALPAQHIRMGNKDYVLIATTNGTLHILSRTGKTRVPVREKFSFSELPITGENGQFVVWGADDTLSKISAAGSVQSSKETVAAGYSRQAERTTVVTLDDNLLRINQQLIELPFGVYTTPTLLQTRNGVYVTVTETQENNVYLYNEEGVLQRGFPVYGSGRFDVSMEQGRLLLVGQGDEKTIIRYDIK